MYFGKNSSRLCRLPQRERGTGLDSWRFWIELHAVYLHSLNMFAIILLSFNINPLGRKQNSKWCGIKRIRFSVRLTLRQYSKNQLIQTSTRKSEVNWFRCKQVFGGVHECRKRVLGKSVDYSDLKKQPQNRFPNFITCSMDTN